VLFVASCQRNSSDYLSAAKQEKPITITDQPVVFANKPVPGGICNPDAYSVTLESKTQVDGNWEWVWSIQNLNAGNGSNGTSQDLSNWGMPLGFCVSWESVVGAGYSANGSNWTNFTPAYEVNPSQGCLTVPVIKFEYGLSATLNHISGLLSTRITTHRVHWAIISRAGILPVVPSTLPALAVEVWKKWLNKNVRLFYFIHPYFLINTWIVSGVC
jgi:hypothetical protein